MLKDKSFLTLLERGEDFKICSYCDEKIPAEIGECPLCDNKS